MKDTPKIKKRFCSPPRSYPPPPPSCPLPLSLSLSPSLYLSLSLSISLPISLFISLLCACVYVPFRHVATFFFFCWVITKKIDAVLPAAAAAGSNILHGAASPSRRLQPRHDLRRRARRDDGLRHGHDGHGVGGALHCIFRVDAMI